MAYDESKCKVDRLKKAERFEFPCRNINEGLYFVAKLFPVVEATRNVSVVPKVQKVAVIH